MLVLALLAAGWVHEGNVASFGWEKDELVCTGRGNSPNWYRSWDEHENIKRSFEYNLAQWAETALLLRAPRFVRPAQSGIAIILAHDFHNQVSKHVTGSIAGAAPPREPLPAAFNVWRKVEVQLDGSGLIVKIDGHVMQSLDLSKHLELADRNPRGYVGFLDLGHGFRIRNWKLEDLGSRGKYSDFESIENWRLRDGGEWLMRDGAIYGANGHGILYAPPILQNFLLTMAVRTHNRANSGVFLRGSADKTKSRGFEVQIYSPPDSVYPTGSIYGQVRSNIEADYEGQWVFLAIRVEGQRCKVWLNGKLTAATDAIPKTALAQGQFGLQIHMENTSAEFRDVRVYPLEGE